VPTRGAQAPGNRPKSSTSSKPARPKDEKGSVWDGQARLDEVNAKVTELMEEYRTGLSGSIVFPMIRRLEDERNELQAEQANFTKMKARKQVTLTGEWDDLDLHEKRAVIQSVIEAVVIRPTGRTGLYDSSRVDVIPLQ
jgi:hypothetical protein